jgi:predicted CopG family antitoxin
LAKMTITIDLEAYRRLNSVRREGESFSQSIKRVVRPPSDLRKWMRDLETHPMSKAAMDAVEAAIRGRQDPTVRRR